MAKFNPALKLTLASEGVVWGPLGNVIHTGHCDDVDDPGGETIYGITRQEATDNGWDSPMVEMPIEFAEGIYRRNYWDKLWGDKISHQGIAEELFDTAVNCGMETSVRFLQRALNVLNVKETLWNNVGVDGIIGGTTIETLEKACASRSYMGMDILRVINGLQISRYVDLCERNKQFETFMPGWVRLRGAGY